MVAKVKLKIAIPKKYKPSDRYTIGQEIIDYIVERTQEGTDKRGKPFKKLSKDYAKFKRSIGAGGQADLTLSGDMLGELDIISDKNGEITLGFEDSEQNDKADGHITGMRGKGVKRDFLGVWKYEVAEIIKDLENDGMLDG